MLGTQKTLKGSGWDFLASDYLKWCRIVLSQPLMTEESTLQEYFRKSESLFSQDDYLSWINGSELERMCTPNEQNNTFNVSFWKGNSVFACVFLCMQELEQKRELLKFFGPFGSIEESLITGKHLAVIKFADIKAAIRAKKWIDNPKYNGPYFSLNYPSPSLWIGNLHPDINEEELHSKFLLYGKIKTVRVFKWKNYAFVNFGSLASAVNALDCMQGQKIRNVAIKINFAVEQ